MTTHKQYFVLRVTICLTVQLAHLTLEALPLGLCAVRVEYSICIVCAVDEAEIGGDL
jgi:hypothetical protein